MTTAPIFAVVAVVRTSKGVLLTSRRNKPNDFGFPGGKVDPGEDAVTAVKREVKEETGLDLFDVELLYISPETTSDKLVAVYTATVDLDQPLKPEEGLNVLWGDLSMTVQDGSTFRDFNKTLLTKLT